MTHQFPMTRILALVATIVITAGLAFIPNQIVPAGQHDFVAGLAVGMSFALALVLLIYMVRPLRERLTSDACDDPQLRALNRRYLREAAPAFGLYLIAVILMRWSADHGQPLWQLALLMLLPLLAIVVIVRAWLHYLRDADELQRRIELESLALAALGVSQLYFAGWFLLQAGLLHLDAADALLWTFVLLVFARVAVRTWLQWKYR